MSLRLTFTKVQLLQFVRKPTGGTLKVSCALTKPVSKAMEWGEFPEWEKSGTLHGRLSASLCEFTPTHSDLAKHAIDLATMLVHNFELNRVQVRNGKAAQKSPSFRTELTCSIEFNDEAGAAKLEAYMQSVPESSMRVTYNPAAVQSELELDEERRQATSAAAD